jgi:hypothetical protein
LVTDDTFVSDIDDKIKRKEDTNGDTTLVEVPKEAQEHAEEAAGADEKSLRVEAGSDVPSNVDHASDASAAGDAIILDNDDDDYAP